MSRIETSSLLVLSTLALALGALLAPAHSAPVAKVETGRIASGDYAQRREAVGEQVRPKEGYQTKLVLRDVVPRMFSHGIIDMTKMEALYKERGGIPPELKQILTQASDTPLLMGILLTLNELTKFTLQLLTSEAAGLTSAVLPRQTELAEAGSFDRKYLRLSLRDLVDREWLALASGHAG